MSGTVGSVAICKHGSLARSCDWCFEVKEARRLALEEAEKLVNEWPAARYVTDGIAEAIRALRNSAK